MQNILARNVIWSLAAWLGIFPAAWAENKQAVSQTDKKIEARFENGEILLSLGSHTRSVPAAFPVVETPLSALEQRLFADAGDGRLDEFSLLDAALIASGVKDSVELGRYEERVATWAGELKQNSDSDSSPRRQVEAMFALMHGKILKGRYNIKCTDLRQALDEGNFNCLSATVLFNCLAGNLGLSCCALETPEHVLSRVYLADGPLDVETTCPKWFSLRHETNFNNVEHKGASPFSPQKGANPFSFNENQDSPSKKDTAKLREISPVQLTALIYYNRAIDFLAEKRFSDAAAANAKALRLDPLNSAARGNLLATINNWAIDLGNAGHYDQAATLLRQGLALDPLYEAFALNFAHVHRQWSQELCNEGRYHEAVELLNRAASEMPENAYFHRAVWGVYRCWAIALLRDNKTDEAFDILRFMN